MSASTEFRECFYLYARSGHINTLDELTVTMRSLGMSPTIAELRAYMREKGGKMSFADFLDTMHTHSKKESVPRELLEAFRNSGWSIPQMGTVNHDSSKGIDLFTS